MPLDSQVQSFLDMLEAQGAPAWSQMRPAEAREMFAGLTPLFGEGPALEHVQDHRLGELALRIYRPAAEGLVPAVLYFHGGGWVLGDLDTHDSLCRRLAAESGCAVVAVDYRRAPEHKYPAALEDCYRATAWVTDRGAALGLDGHRIAVAGDSAGGNLAAAVALKARDEAGPPLRLQVLMYPVLDPSFETPSYTSFATGFGLTRDSMIWFWEQYVGTAFSAVNAYAAPARAADLVRLPSAHVLTAEYDVLRDEGEAFANRLKRAGVAVELRRYTGVIHGFVHFSGAFDAGRRAVSDVAAVLKGALHH